MPAGTSHAQTTAGIRRAMMEGRDPKHYKGPLTKAHLTKNKQGKVVSKAKQQSAKNSPHLQNWGKFMKENRNKPVGTKVVYPANGTTYKVIKTKTGMQTLKKA